MGIHIQCQIGVSLHKQIECDAVVRGTKVKKSLMFSEKISDFHEFGQIYDIPF